MYIKDDEERIVLKYLTVDQLRDVLADVDGDLIIYPNNVGNLAIAKDPFSGLVAYVDFLFDGEVEYFDVPDEE